MGLKFARAIDLVPIPVEASNAARQAVAASQRAAELGGLAAVKAAMVDRIFAATPQDPPAEQKRLQLLYQNVYTREEIERLVGNTLVQLGFGRI